jgi:hypothetical protein
MRILFFSLSVGTTVLPQDATIFAQLPAVGVRTNIGRMIHVQRLHVFDHVTLLDARVPALHARPHPVQLNFPS